jgi:histidinol-phosphate aminotransferase
MVGFIIKSKGKIMNFNSVLDNCKIYEAGKPIELIVREYGIQAQDVIKLASNENPYGTSPKVVKKLQSLCSSVFMYPDDSLYELKDALASKYEVTQENIIIGSGSDQLLNFCVKAKCNEDSKILMSKTTFALYEIYGKQVGCKILKTKDDEHNLEQFLEVYKKEGADIIFLCLPNNPLGECLDKKDVYNFLKEVHEDTLVIVDGAYQEYASYKDENKAINPSDLINTFPNCIYLGTFSKAYSLGGLRVGYGIAKKGIIESLHKLRPPFNITNLSLAAAVEALNDEVFVSKCIEKNFVEMKRYEEYTTNKGLSYIESYTNFITLKFEGLYVGSKVSSELLKKGIIIRDLSPYGLNAIRITIGTQEQNTKVFETLDEVLDLCK